MERKRLVVALAALAAGTGVAWVMFANDVREHSGLEVVLVLVTGWSFVAAGLAAWQQRPENRIGRVMVATGVLWFAGALFASQNPLVFTIGHALEGAFFAGVVYVILAFPGGRLEGTYQRLLFGAAVLAVGPVNVVRLMVGGHDVRQCVGCPPDVIIELVDWPALAQPLQLAVYGGGAGVAVLSTGVLVQRWRHATPRLRFAIAPVLWVGAVALAAVVAWAVLVAVSDPTRTAATPTVVLTLVIAPVAFAFLVGLERTRMARSAVADLVIELGRTPGPGELRAALVRALRDPSLDIAYWVPDAGRFVDAEGHAVVVPGHDVHRGVTLVHRDDRTIAALLHDPALRDDVQLVESVCAAAGLALENERLQAELRARLTELTASRARIVEAAQAERRRIERDLHDGTQQRLVAVAMTLGLTDAQLAADPRSAQTLLREGRAGLSEALEELRELSHGIHPGILTERGLAPALQELCFRGHLPIDLEVILPQRLPDQVETAAYFLVAESLTNLAKHAHATHARVRVEHSDGRLLIHVADDGMGGADPSRGSGLRGLSDRVEALGGRFRFTSPPGLGTIVEADIPCA